MCFFQLQFQPVFVAVSFNEFATHVPMSLLSVLPTVRGAWPCSKDRQHVHTEILGASHKDNYISAHKESNVSIVLESNNCECRPAPQQNACDVDDRRNLNAIVLPIAEEQTRNGLFDLICPRKFVNLGNRVHKCLCVNVATTTIHERDTHTESSCEHVNIIIAPTLRRRSFLRRSWSKSILA